MPNPLFDAMNQGQMAKPGVVPQQAPQIDIFSLIRNPQQAMALLASRNPEMYQMLQNGGTMEQVVRHVCQQRGIDINGLIKQYGPMFNYR